MSWDVWLFVPPSDTAAVSDLQADYSFPPLDPDAVLEAARSVFPSATVIDGRFVNIEGPEFFAEAYLPDPQGETAQSRGSFTMNVRGFDESTIEQILTLASELGCRALDLQTGDWLTPETGAASLGSWADYQERVTQGPS
jgi:hypothetical protein